MNNLKIYKPPMLSVIEQEIKLREIPDEERLMKCTQIVANLLLDLGVGSKSDPQQHLRVIKFLVDDCGKYTVKEVEYAFKLAIQGKLEIDLFQQINVLVVGKVLNAFDNYKNEKLRNFRTESLKRKQIQKEMTEEEIEYYTNSLIKEQFNLFVSRNTINHEKFYAYDVLDKRGYMPIDLKYKNEVKNDAINILLNEYNLKKATSMDEKRSLKSDIENIKKGKSGKIANKCKELAIYDFFIKLTKDDELMVKFKKEFKIDS